MMKKIQQLSFVLVMILAMPLAVLAAPPSVPLLVYGNVTIDSSPALIGTVITIEKDSIQIVSVTTSTVGKYFIEVPAENAGETLTYKVNDIFAVQKEYLNPVTTPSDKIDLAITTSEPEPEPTLAPTPISAPSGGGGGGGGSTPSSSPSPAPAPPSTPISPADNPLVVQDPLPLPVSQILSVSTYANGTLLRGPDKKIYVLINGQKQHISSLAELQKYAGRPTYDVSDTVIAQYASVSAPAFTQPQVAGLVTYANGTLLRGPDKKIYVLINGQKQHISSLAELQKYAGRPTNNVASSVIDQYSDYQSSTPASASTVAGVYIYANGTLLRGPDKKIYVLINGQKKHILNLIELQKYAGQPLYSVSDAVIAQYSIFDD